MMKVLNEQLVDTKKITNILVTIVIIIGAFVVPTFLAKIIPLGKYQQLVVGTIVNMSLILTALYTKGSIKTVAIATLPSISTILGGLLFGGMTLYSKTMIPAIWLGNFAFILLYKVLYVNKSWKYLVVASMAVLTKTMIIYLGFMIMVNTMIVPDMVKQTLSTSMGITQLITATSGSLLVTLIMILTRVKRDKVKQ
ncbi:MAG: hypothetical protein HFJ26_00050 [Clostridia bacterium]|nr:hypothetical protein [Clostridia bacterium]